MEAASQRCRVFLIQCCGFVSLSQDGCFWKFERENQTARCKWVGTNVAVDWSQDCINCKTTVATYLCFLPSCHGRILLLFDNDFLAEIFLQKIHIPSWMAEFFEPLSSPCLGFQTHYKPHLVWISEAKDPSSSNLYIYMCI